MAAEDATHWDRRYRSMPTVPQPGPPKHLPDLADFLPRSGSALELACGRGEVSVWLANQGLTVTGVDVSPVAIAAARDLAETHRVSNSCSFKVLDLDTVPGLAVPVDLLLCHLFIPALDTPDLIPLIAEGGIVAIATLSEVGFGPGRFRMGPGELLRLFEGLDVIEHGEADGVAYLLARRPKV